ncbi:hypothetical protein LUW74_22720 [Actinomadura madurae]|uniref:hypothetical protein n=1 Tax=Actinomadura madurae TaxID=1993 RepID=UPI002026749F|nr:hypothetical protein [Actinomadura madurae]URN05843.1 hypothetical protein LUW74_22720 [Actinomadura madurae]
MGGYELWEHIKSQFPEITNEEIGRYAGTTGSNISHWKRGHQPSFDHVQTLARNLPKYPRFPSAWGCTRTVSCA